MGITHLDEPAHLHRDRDAHPPSRWLRHQPPRWTTPRRPRDKAKVENAVLVAQRWILARLRDRKFFSLTELNEAIAELLDELNTRPFKKLEGCRRSAFVEIDRPAMHPLPAIRFEMRERHKARVNIDYHVEFDHRLYSVPYKLIGEKVEVRATTAVVEIFLTGERVASHARSYGRRGTAVTCDEHRPPQHQQQKWPPERLVAWAATFGPAVATIVERTLAQYVHPEHGYRACLGILRVAEKHGADRMQAACSRALAASSSRAPHRKYIEAILRQGLDREPGPAVASRTLPLEHENVRGGEYYDRKETIH
jgi:transposase